MEQPSNGAESIDGEKDGALLVIWRLLITNEKEDRLEANHYFLNVSQMQR